MSCNILKLANYTVVIFFLVTPIFTFAQAIEPTECNKIINSSFEEPSISGSWQGLNANQVPGWNINTGTIEIWNNFPGYPSQSGNHHLELNGTAASTIYQDVTTTPKANMIWSLWHRSRSGSNEKIRVIINGRKVKDITTSSRSWIKYSGKYKVPDNKNSIRFSIKAITSGTVGNLIDAVYFGLDPTKNATEITFTVPDEVCTDTEFNMSANINNGSSPYKYEFSISNQPYIESSNNTYIGSCAYSTSPQSIKVRITDNKGCKYISEKNVTVLNKISTKVIAKIE